MTEEEKFMNEAREIRRAEMRREFELTMRYDFERQINEDFDRAFNGEE